MLKTTILIVVAALIPITATSAQSSPVKNTGCPGALYPTVTNTRINQTATFSFPKMSVLDTPVMVLGFQSGNSTVLNSPLTCVNGCKLYTTMLVVTAYPRGTTSVKLPIPNDIRLFQRCFGVQTAGVTIRGCVDLHGSVSWCVGR